MTSPSGEHLSSSPLSSGRGTCIKGNNFDISSYHFWSPFHPLHALLYVVVHVYILYIHTIYYFVIFHPYFFATRTSFTSTFAPPYIEYVFSSLGWIEILWRILPPQVYFLHKESKALFEVENRYLSAVRETYKNMGSTTIQTHSCACPF